MTEPWTIKKVVQWAADDFRTRNFESPRAEAEILLCHALEFERIRIILDGEKPLRPAELQRYRELIVRRRAREPVAYLLGKREFFGREFRVDKRVLVPRPDTETLVDVALRRTEPWSMYARVLDMCTGSGCVVITLARERKTWRFDACDLSTDALEVAKWNALRLGALRNISWIQGDLFASLSPQTHRYELIVANPPYIPEQEWSQLDSDVRDFEPKLALSGGDDGLVIVRKIIEQAPRYLIPGGILALEHMAGQGAAVAELMKATGFEAIEHTRDYGKHDRVVSGQWPVKPT
jgi:release factor glutamine methyltransferase